MFGDVIKIFTNFSKICYSQKYVLVMNKMQIQFYLQITTVYYYGITKIYKLRRKRIDSSFTWQIS